jgi:hypothetical protein
MIDTYADRADATLRYQPAPIVTPIYKDPLYWSGRVWPSEIARQCAIASASLAYRLDLIACMHHTEIFHGVPVGCECSRFQDDGKLKPQFRSQL